MNRITIFSAPKPFTDPHINIIQRNAIRSWKALGSQVEVLIIGDEPGMREVAEELDIVQIPEVELNDQGTPLVSSIFRLARERSSHEIMIYLNADIILLPECLSVINAIHKLQENFLLVGHRWDLDIDWEVDFSKDWAGELSSLLEQEGRFRIHTAMDYFIFPRNLLQDIPSFAVGRAGWDNWMIYHAINQPWPVIDITLSHRVIHQSHDYRHLPNGVIHYDLEESYQNVALAGGMRRMYDLLDVPLVFHNGKIQKKRLNLRRAFRKAERLVMPPNQEGLRWGVTLVFRRLGRKLDRYG